MTTKQLIRGSLITALISLPYPLWKIYNNDLSSLIVEKMTPKVVVVLLSWLILASMILLTLILSDSKKQTSKKPFLLFKRNPKPDKPNLVFYKDFKWNLRKNSFGGYDVSSTPFCKKHGIKYKDNGYHLYCPVCNDYFDYSSSQLRELISEIENIVSSKGIKYLKKLSKKTL